MAEKQRVLTKKDVWEQVTARVVTELEKGRVPWVRPWSVLGAPRNLAGREYRGVNVFLLEMERVLRGYEQPLWATMRQINEAGGSVLKGTKSAEVVFWKVNQYEDRDPDTGEVSVCRVPLLRTYHVFNVEATTLQLRVAPATRGFEPIEAAELLWKGYEGRPPVVHGGDRAVYRVVRDEVHMPRRERFRSEAAYYTTLFHEGVHSTGAEKRLARATLMDASYFGAPNYCQEELVAEMGAAMLMCHAGLDVDFPQTAAYLGGWLERLRADKKMLVVAAQQAQKAVEHILGAGAPKGPSPEVEA